MKNIILFIFFLIPFQDIVASFFFKLGFPNIIIFIFVVLKEILLCMIIILNINLVSKIKLPFILYLLFILLFYSLLVDNLPFDMKFNGFRTYFLLFCSLLVGMMVGKERILHFFDLPQFKIIFLFFFFFSFLQHFILPNTVFKYIFPILDMKKEALGMTITNEFYDSGLPVNYMGELSQRMLGPFDEPLYTAYFALIPFNLYLCKYVANKKRIDLIFVFFSFLIIILSQTRAVLISAIILILTMIIENRLFRKYIIYLLPIFFIFIVYKLNWLLVLFDSLFTIDGRSMDHYLAYVVGFGLIFNNPLGIGLGSANTFNGFSDFSNVMHVENAFINLILDLGIIFFIFFLLLFFKIAKKKVANIEEIGLKIFVYQFFFMGLVAPHVFTIRILIPYMILIGSFYEAKYFKNLHYNINNY